MGFTCLEKLHLLIAAAAAAACVQPHPLPSYSPGRAALCPGGMACWIPLSASSENAVPAVRYSNLEQFGEGERGLDLVGLPAELF